MGYIKKLKNNELVGGTDKHTIYPVTSTEAVFEEITNGNESSFKSQKTINKEHQDILDDHEDRIQEAEVNDVKSITINGSTKKFVVDDENNVDLTVYTVDDDPEMPDIADKVDELRNMVGTSTPVLETSHKTRIETLEGGDSVTGSVENKIKTKVDSINSSYQDDDNEYVKYSMTQTSGEVTNFNIDETSLKNAITSLNSSISGDNIVIRSGSTPSGTGEAGKIYRYVNSSNNTYTDYMYSGGSWVTLAVHDTSDEQAQVAYYTCITSGSGAQAVKQFISSGTLTYTPSSGGHIKILMGERNTATGTIYLQYNTDATNTKKPLYYNGEPVSATNTWDAGEVIAVYYDTTNNRYQASNAQGGSNKKIDAYLYGDLRTLAVGQTYKLNEAVKTTDKQLLKVSKEIGLMNLIDTVAVGDLKVYGTGANAATYKALKAVSTYNGVDTEGLYAIGNPSIATITVDASSLSIEEDTDISVTIGSATHTITVPAAESETKAADIAALIAAAFTSIPGWSLTDNSDGTLTLKCNTGGANSISVSSEVGETGLVITSSIINGGNKLSKYSNGAWQAVTLANYAADFADVGVVDNTKMWQKVDATWLTTLSNGVVAQANSPKLYDTFGYDSNGAITRKVATEEMMYYESIALHNYLITGTYMITVGTTQWNSNARNDIYVIPVESNNVYRITSSNEIQYCWMSDYVTPNAGDYIKNVPGYVCTRTTSRFIDITAPLGAKYLYVLSVYRTSTSSTSFDPSSISVLKSKLGEIQPLVESNSYDLYIEDFKLSSLPNSTEPKGVAGNNRYSWNTTSNYYGVWINVTAYAGRRIRFKVPAERYMFVSSKPSASTNPLTTLLGNGIVQRNGNDTIIPNPETENGQVWMWVYTYNKDRTPQTTYTISNISVLQKMADSLTSISEDTNNALKYTSAKEVTLANLPGTKSNGLVEMTGTSYSVNNNYYGYWYDVTYYAGKKIRLEKGRYDLFFSTQILTTNTQIAPYALGVGFVRGEAEEIGDVKIPSPSTTDGKVYCWVLTHESTITHPSKYYSIVENVPDRIKDITENTIYSQDKILYWARYTNSNAKNFGLLHFSDFHGDSDAYYELQDYISRHSSMFNDVIETGDNVYNYNSDWKGKVNNKALFVLGNHDCGVGGNVRKDGIGRQACFNYYFNPYLSYWKANEEGGVQIDNENYAMYWYKDYTGIRLIGLDGMHFMGRDDITDEDQETWFEETLNDAKTKGLKVMVACHFGLDDFSGEYSRWNEQTHKWEYNFITDTSNSNTGGRVMNSSTGKAVPYHWYGNNSWTWDKNGFTMRVQQACNGYSVGTNRFGDILSNWIDGGGTFIAWIGGHVHQNLMYYPARYPNILNIIVSNAGTRVDSPYEYKRNNGDFVRIAANIYYVSGDYLTIVKVGDNIQRPSLVPMFWLTINYRTGEVTSCY